MEIVNFRVDDRLVHGVVATYWIPSLNVDRVIAIDKESAENPILKSALRMATPKSVNLSVIDSEKAIGNIVGKRYGNEKILLVTKKPEEIASLIKGGVKVNKLVMGNLGNINRKADAIVLSKYLSVTEGDMEVLNFIKDSGARITAQLVPNDPEEDFFALYNKKK